MKYFPIFDELFSSDSVIFLLIGLALALVIGLTARSEKVRRVGIAASLAVYVACELLSNLRAVYMTKLAFLLIGTTAIGCCIGFLIAHLVRTLKK